MPLEVLAGLAVTSHNDAALNTASFSNVAVLPPGWSGQSVGNPPLAGAASLSAKGEWMVSGSGADIAATTDQFHFVSRNFTGDGSLTTHITSVEASDPYSKAGVMFRESEAADSKYAFAFAGPGTVGFECRTATGATMTAVAYIGQPAPAWVRLKRDNGTFSASYSLDGTTWTALGTPLALTMSPSSKAGLAVTSHDIAETCEATFESVSVLPAAWTATDIGTPDVPGGTTFDSTTGTWTLTGSGTDIWGTTDQLHFASQSLTGDGVITARLTALANTDPWAKAGLMMRESTAPDARNVMLLTTPGNGANLQSRATPGAATINSALAAATPPVWLRLLRSGNTFTGWQSTDGTTWTNPRSVTLSPGNTVLAGLAVTSHATGTFNSASFDNLAVTPLPPGTVSWNAFQQLWFTPTQIATPSLSNPSADCNNDGIPNLFSYGSGLSPWNQSTTSNGGRPYIQTDGTYQTITFTRLKFPFDFTYTVEVSDNLILWNSGPAHTTQLSITSLDATREQVTVRDNTPIAPSSPRRYMRLRATLSPP